MSAPQPQLADAPHQVMRIEAVGAGVDAEGQRRGHLAGLPAVERIRSPSSGSGTLSTAT